MKRKPPVVRRPLSLLALLAASASAYRPNTQRRKRIQRNRVANCEQLHRYRREKAPALKNRKRTHSRIYANNRTNLETRAVLVRRSKNDAGLWKQSNPGGRSSMIVFLLSIALVVVETPVSMTRTLYRGRVRAHLVPFRSMVHWVSLRTWKIARTRSLELKKPR